ncbi:SDR family oxidoreductase [Alteromonadaceae bacterium BrNp21-10]|nr:SDR family oxidoreductase [Alteromonadaceae bacterium BrNp21-10]
MRLQGKRILITAAAQGIGKATAELFTQQGAIVYASDINMPLLKEVNAHQHIQLDVTDGSAVNAVVESIGAIDVLFNCAGFVHDGGILECDEKAFDFSMDLNVKSAYLLCRAVIPQMLQQDGGTIINMSSVASSITGIGNRFAYGATKAAVIGLTKAIAAEFVGQGIRCNAICPGTVQSPSLEQRMSKNGDYEATRANFVARQPMGRLGESAEIANLALYLASDESSYTTGQIHVIDGGWTI